MKKKRERNEGSVGRSENGSAGRVQKFLGCKKAAVIWAAVINSPCFYVHIGSTVFCEKCQGAGFTVRKCMKVATHGPGLHQNPSNVVILLFKV